MSASTAHRPGPRRPPATVQVSDAPGRGRPSICLSNKCLVMPGGDHSLRTPGQTQEISSTASGPSQRPAHHRVYPQSRTGESLKPGPHSAATAVGTSGEPALFTVSSSSGCHGHSHLIPDPTHSPSYLPPQTHATGLMAFFLKGLGMQKAELSQQPPGFHPRHRARAPQERTVEPAPGRHSLRRRLWLLHGKTPWHPGESVHQLGPPRRKVSSGRCIGGGGGSGHNAPRSSWEPSSSLKDPSCCSGPSAPRPLSY